MSFWDYLLATLMVLSAIFLILLILVQRGRGGGLAGALGGMGGQSAFGTKAGDLFTRVTIVAAVFWILLCVVAVKAMSRSGGQFATGGGQPSSGSATPVDRDSKLDDVPAAGAEGAKSDAAGEASNPGRTEPGASEPAANGAGGASVPPSGGGSDAGTSTGSGESSTTNEAAK